MSAWLLELGIPRRQVIRFQAIAPTSAAITTAWVVVCVVDEAGADRLGDRGSGEGADEVERGRHQDGVGRAQGPGRHRRRDRVGRVVEAVDVVEDDGEDEDDDEGRRQAGHARRPGAERGCGAWRKYVDPVNACAPEFAQAGWRQAGRCVGGNEALTPRRSAVDSYAGSLAADGAQPARPVPPVEAFRRRPLSPGGPCVAASCPRRLPPPSGSPSSARALEVLGPGRRRPRRPLAPAGVRPRRGSRRGASSDLSATGTWSPLPSSARAPASPHCDVSRRTRLGPPRRGRPTRGGVCHPLA